MRFKADEIVSVLQTEIGQYRSKLEAQEVGRVLEVGDGIARIYGLSGIMAGEMVEFTRTGVRGLAFNLEENSVGVIILGDYLEIAEGDDVRGPWGELLRVPVGDALIGRVVNPLGIPLDGARARSFRPRRGLWNQSLPGVRVAASLSISLCKPASRPSTP